MLAFWRMARPSQILLIAAVYLFGFLIAKPGIVSGDIATFVMGLIPLILISASVHYANEYADVETDRLTTRTRFSGGSGALPDLNLSPEIAFTAAKVTFGLGMLSAGLLTLEGGIPPVSMLILLLGGLIGWMYSLPPVKLAWRGFGEVTNSALGGVLLPIYGYIIASQSIQGPLVFILPFGVYAFLNLLATQWPDRAADQIVGKRALASRWEPRRLSRLYWAVLIAAVTLMVVQSAIGAPTVIVVLGLITIPAALWGAKSYTRQEDPFPSVLAMLLLLFTQLAGWGWLTLQC
jgi:1,4-dihydroxy-2-naphthoate octaprenyltransferase